MIFLAKSYGPLKYFHPSDAIANYLDKVVLLSINEILNGKSFEYCWNNYLKPLVVNTCATNLSDCVVWQHHGVDTKNDFYKNRIREFISIKTNRPFESLLPIRFVGKEIFGNFNNAQLKLEFDGNIDPFIFGLDMNAYLITPEKKEDLYSFKQDTYGLYIGINLKDQHHHLRKLQLRNLSDGRNLLPEIIDEVELKGWNLNTNCYKWDQEENSFVCQIDRLIINQIVRDLPEINETFTIQISNDEYVEIPVCLDRNDALISLNQKNVIDEIVSQSRRFNVQDFLKGYQLFDIITFWNIIYLFHPYIDKIEGFEKELETAMSRYLEGIDHQKNILKIGTKMNDGHFFPKFNEQIFRSDLSLVHYKDRVYVGNNCEGNFEGFEGKEVSKVNGKKINDLLNEELKYISSSSQRKKKIAVFNILSGNNGDRFTLTTVDGNTLEGNYHRPFPPKPKALPPNALLDENILYININTLDYEKILELITQQNNLKGIIFDNRFYPLSNHAILCHFMKEDLTSKTWCQMPIYVRPRTINKIADAYLKSGWSMRPRTPYFDIPTCLLIDQTTQSYGESWTTMYQAINPSGIIGRSTSGANGDINFLDLPTGGKISWSCRRIVDHFGEIYFSSGIRPAIEVEENFPGVQPTFENDNFIQAALKYLIEQK